MQRKALEWGGEDLNLCRHTPADLQSAPFGRSGTSPAPDCGNLPDRAPCRKAVPRANLLGLRRLWTRSRGLANPTRGPGFLWLDAARSESARDRERLQSSEHNRAGEGTRTPNRLITNEMLYQLSYASPDAPAEPTMPFPTLQTFRVASEPSEARPFLYN